MGPYHNWKAKTEKEKRETDLENALKNQQLKEEVAKNRKDAEIPGTWAYNKFHVGIPPRSC